MANLFDWNALDQPLFVKPRQADNWFGLTPYRSATAFTVAPGSSVSATT